MKKTESSSPIEFSAGLQRYLYVTAFLSGAAILIVEIVGAKMLAPYFGASHFVWTAQIVVTLVSLALGYGFGGWAADHYPKVDRLYACIFAAGVYLCASVWVCRPVAERCLDFSLAAGSLAASAFLFAVPLALLATVGPFLVRILSVSVETAGSHMGRLTALGTAGSVLGAMLVGYVMVPFLPNSVTLFGTAAALIVLALGYFASRGKNKPVALVLLAAGALGTGLEGVRADGPMETRDLHELARRNSNFGMLQVMQSPDGTRRYLLNDFLSQNGYDTVRKQSTHVFSYVLHGLAHAYTDKIEDVLCIGLGVGIVPQQFAREGAKVDVVEINPAILPLAKAYFDFDAAHVNLTLDDGRHFLNRRARQYDVILLDAFLGESTPTHLMTREAFAAMRAALKPGGTLLINCFGYFEPGHAYMSASLDKTLRAVFKSVVLHAAESGTTFFVASDRAELVFVHAPAETNVHPDVAREFQATIAGVVRMDPAEGRILTDDYNPLEFYDAANRERLRRSLALSMTS